MKSIREACKDLQAMNKLRDRRYYRKLNNMSDEAKTAHFAPYQGDGQVGCLRFIQSLIREALNVDVIAYGGSIGLWLQGEVETFGDLDIFTNKQFSKQEILDAGFVVNDVTDVGWQWHDLNLDIFFTETERSAQHLRLGLPYVRELKNGIWVHDASYIMAYNSRFHPDIKFKKRKMREPTGAMRRAFERIAT